MFDVQRMVTDFNINVRPDGLFDICGVSFHTVLRYVESCVNPTWRGTRTPALNLIDRSSQDNPGVFYRNLYDYHLAAYTAQNALASSAVVVDSVVDSVDPVADSVADSVEDVADDCVEEIDFADL